jgi:hypothetical protein
MITAKTAYQLPIIHYPLPNITLTNKLMRRSLDIEVFLGSSRKVLSVSQFQALLDKHFIFIFIYFNH